MSIISQKCEIDKAQNPKKMISCENYIGILRSTRRFSYMRLVDAPPRRCRSLRLKPSTSFTRSYSSGSMLFNRSVTSLCVGVIIWNGVGYRHGTVNSEFFREVQIDIYVAVFIDLYPLNDFA